MLLHSDLSFLSCPHFSQSITVICGNFMSFILFSFCTLKQTLLPIILFTSTSFLHCLGQTSSSIYGMSGSENRLWPLEACVLWCWYGGEGVTKEMEEEEEEVEGGQEENCNNRSCSAPSMYMDWVLSLRRPGCSLLLIKCVKARLPGGV